MTEPRIALTIRLAGAAIAAATLACASLWAESRPTNIPGIGLSAHPSEVRLACPTGVIDPFDTSNVAPGTTWTSLHSNPETPAPAQIASRGTTIPSALTLVGQGGGELAGLSAPGCAAPRTSQWIATGATTSGADMVLILSNPGPTTSVVTVDGYGTSGPLNSAPRHVTVAPTSTASVLLAGWFPDEPALALHVQADGGGVAAWTQASLMNGDIPQGTTLASAIMPATDQTILGINPKGTSLLRLMSPSGDAHVSVSVADSRGIHPLAGGQATVAQGTTLDMPLAGASNDTSPIALIVASDREIVAQTTTITLGAPWAQRASALIMRSNASPATSLSRADLPGTSTLNAMATQVLSATPIRATSIETPSGVNAVRASLLLYNPADTTPTPTDEQNTTAPTPHPTPNIWVSPSPEAAQSQDQNPHTLQGTQSEENTTATPGAVRVRVGDRHITIAPGVPTLVDLPDHAEILSSDAPIHAAIIIVADTAAGTMTTTWNVGTEGISAANGTIRVSN